MSGKLTGSAPILAVNDVKISAEYYRDKLGFTITNVFGAPPYFAIIQRDNLSMMFAKAPKDKIVPNWKIVEKTSNVYFWVNNIDELYEEFIDNGADIDYELYTTPYGIREFGINDPDDYDIAFGEIIK